MEIRARPTQVFLFYPKLRRRKRKKVRTWHVKVKEKAVKKEKANE